MKDNLETKKKLCDFFALLYTVFAFIAFGGGVAFSSLDNFFPFLTGLLLTAVFGHAAFRKFILAGQREIFIEGGNVYAVMTQMGHVDVSGLHQLVRVEKLVLLQYTAVLGNNGIASESQVGR